MSFRRSGMRRCSVSVLLVAACLAPRIDAQEIHITFVAPDRTYYFNPETGDATVCVELSMSQASTDETFPADTQGFTFALAHDAAVLAPVSAAVIGPLADLNDGDGPDYFYFNDDLEKIDGVAIFVIYDFLSAGGETVVAFDEETAVVELCYDTVPGELTGDETPTETAITWTDVDGDPPVSNVVTVDLRSVEPAFDHGTLTLEPRTTLFLRGDANGNGAVSALVDSLHLLQWQFLDGEDPPCMAAADADGNGAVSALVDSLHLLQWQFLDGEDPPPPGAERCGPDAVGATLSCDTLPDCS